MKIIQITDTHMIHPGDTLYGIDPAKQLERALADVMRRHADADLLVMTGDLCNHGEPEAYAHLRSLLADVPFPVRLLLGNHDDRPNFRAAFPDHPVDDAGYVQSHLDTDYGRLLFLDSHAHCVIGGEYGPDRLAFLDRALADAGDKPVTVFIHHPPMETGIAHFRHIGMHDDGALYGRLCAHRAGVRHVVFGHIHVLLSGMTPEGIAYSSGQACAHRFIADVDRPDPEWTDGNPCYRVIVLDRLGFRAFAAEADQRAVAPSIICMGP